MKIVVFEVDDSIYQTLSDLLTNGDTLEEFLSRFMRAAACCLAANGEDLVQLASIARENIPSIEYFVKMLESKEDGLY